jgi:hypothetical protein
MTIPIVEERMRPRRLTVSHREKRNRRCGFDLMNRENGAGRRSMLGGRPATRLSRASPRQG